MSSPVHGHGALAAPSSLSDSPSISFADQSTTIQDSTPPTQPPPRTSSPSSSPTSQARPSSSPTSAPQSASPSSSGPLITSLPTSSFSSTSSSSTQTAVTFGNLPHSSAASISVPQTTFFASFSGNFPDSTSDPSLASPTAAQRSSNNFWANKGAVAGTFTVVSIIIFSIFVAAGAILLKKRKNWQSDDDAYFEKYASQDNATIAGAPTIDGTIEDPESNMTEAMAPAPVDAYPDRQIHYGNIDSSQSEHAIYDAYAIGYPPAVDYPPQATYQQNGAHYQETYAEPASASSVATSAPYSPPHQYSDPHNASYTGFAPPVSFRDPGARGSGYNQSIDSFYGGPAADDSSVNVY